ncbi:MAG: N-acetylmuramic acid 6-phosphate etherase [Bacteroidia bacterium]
MRSWPTEDPPPYEDLHAWEVEALTQAMNDEDHKVAPAVRKALPQIQALLQALIEPLQSGGRLFYVGSGTSGRLGVLDAAECPPTFGAPPGKVVGIIAGGLAALQGPVEAAEDQPAAAIRDLQSHILTSKDCVIGISASGRTPYTLAAVHYARSLGALTGCITTNPATPLAQAVAYPIEVLTGPEFLRGSTRLKSGTAQKMVLNMISTIVFIRLGHVWGNRMIDLQLVNQKLHHRAIRYLQEVGGLSVEEAEALLSQTRSLRAALQKLGRL